MASRPEALTRVVKALGDERSKVALDNFVGMNKHWRGAYLDDVLDALVDSDSYIEHSEPMFEEHERDIQGIGSEYFSPALCALVLESDGKGTTWEAVRQLMMDAAAS